MKIGIRFFALMLSLFWSEAFAQTSIPPGTVLPAQ
jgi:hypothetical protein